MSKESIKFIVEDGYNTSYIDSLLMGLFYSSSGIEYEFLNSNLDPKYHYLQDMIKWKFLDVVRKGFSVTSDTINEIRNYMFQQCGWLNKSNTIYDISSPQDITKFYKFIIDIFNGTLIETQKEIIDRQNNSIKQEDKKSCHYISFNLDDSSKAYSIKNLLSEWFDTNPKDIPTGCQGKNTTEVKYAKNIPFIISLEINRFKNTTKNTAQVDIKKKIKMKFKMNTDEKMEMKWLYNNVRWLFHAVICHTGDSIETGHYYALLSCGEKWLLFDNSMIPCIKEIRTTDSQIVDKIKRECVLVIYRRQDIFS